MPVGIQLDFALAKLSALMLVYDAPYSDVTEVDDVLLPAYSVANYTHVCVAALPSNASAVAALVACGERAAVSALTISATAAYLHNGVYW